MLNSFVDLWPSFKSKRHVWLLGDMLGATWPKISFAVNTAKQSCHLSIIFMQASKENKAASLISFAMQL